MRHRVRPPLALHTLNPRALGATRGAERFPLEISIAPGLHNPNHCPPATQESPHTENTCEACFWTSQDDGMRTRDPPNLTRIAIELERRLTAIRLGGGRLV